MDRTVTALEARETRPPRGDRSAHEIIATARSVTRQTGDRAPMRMAAVCAMLSGGLLWASFPPLGLSPLAWVALVPLLLLVRIERPTRRMYWASYLGGLAFFVPAVQWLRYGDPTMYVAWIALAMYLAVSFPILVAVSRVAVHRWSWPLVVAAPVVWVGLEYARAHLLTGFAWYFVGHTQYRWLELIQISDLVGAYGVSFVMLTSTAALASLVPDRWLRRSGLLPQSVALAQPAEGVVVVIPARTWPTIWALCLFAATLVYGGVRRSQADFQPGPRVALIQGNFVASLRIPPEDYGHQFTTHLRLMAQSLQAQPDVIVWPEAMFRWPLTGSPPGLADDELQALAPKAPPAFWRDTSVRETLENEARKTAAAIIFGIENVDLQTTGAIQRTNSAVLVRPDIGLMSRYDKNHLVPFGEYLPFEKTLPWLQNFTPYPPDFSLHAGESGAAFDVGNWRMVPVICFEDTVPHLVRRMVATASNQPDRPVDLIVNLSNDGWFHGSSGLDQHLITAAFRAVECRTPMVRAVNTGISAFIDGDGAILDPETFIDGDRKDRTSPRDSQTGGWHKQLNAALVSTVPLDRRQSLYVWWGDWFGMLSLTALVGLAVSGRLPTRRPSPSSQVATAEAEAPAAT